MDASDGAVLDADGSTQLDDFSDGGEQTDGDTGQRVDAGPCADGSLPSDPNPINDGGLEAYSHKHAADIKIMPDTWPLPGQQVSSFSLVAARGEYKPFSFVMHNSDSETARRIMLTPSDLTRCNGTIPASAMDIKVVKVWYQRYRAWYSGGQHPGQDLVPELLLHDDDLVRVDTKSQSNLLKLQTTPVSYLKVNDPNPDVGAHPYLAAVPSIDELPVEDATTLLPFEIPGETNKQIFVIIHVPDDAVSGTYYGRINVSIDGDPAGYLGMELEVLPFDLSESKIEFSMYYRGHLQLSGPKAHVISSDYKNRVQYKADMQNLWDHGIHNPNVYQGYRGEALEILTEMLTIREEVGMTGQPLYLLQGDLGNWTTVDENTPALLTRRFGKFRTQIDPIKYPAIYWYGIDEARGDRLLSGIPYWKALHEGSGYVFVAIDPTEYATQAGVAETLDLPIVADRPQPKLASLAHSFGHRIGHYADSFTDLECPIWHRRNQGINLWAADYDVSMEYVYQSNLHEGSAGTWNDAMFGYRTMAIAYPGMTRPINTLAIEGFREAYNDMRYITTLEDRIAELHASGDKTKIQQADDAQAFLDNLRQQVLSAMGGGKYPRNYDDPDLDQVRSQVIKHLKQLY